VTVVPVSEQAVYSKTYISMSYQKEQRRQIADTIETQIP
jgi:hypothetical protein